MGWLKSLFGNNDQEYEQYQTAVTGGRTIVAIDTTEDRIETTADLLDRHNPLSVKEEPASSGAAVPRAASAQAAVPRMASAQAGGRAASGENQTGSIPVIKEDINVGKRTFVRGGVRVYSRVVEKPFSQDVHLRDEKAYVQREPADRPVKPGEMHAGTGDQVIEVKEYTEEPVVEKRARVVEDVHVGKNVNERTETVQDTVRHTEVDVQPLQAERASMSSSPGSIEESDYRRHFQQNYGNAGGSYDTYAPGYQYGESLARDPRFKGRTFSDVEPDLRSEYQRKYPGGSWEKMKDSVRYGWDRVTGKA
jgi:stress response protein YsnF